VGTSSHEYLARLLRDTNRQDEALAEIYNWSTEGLMPPT